jgi:hypothetical protein
MVVLLVAVACANTNADCVSANASTNTITIKLLLLILFMIQVSPSPPLRKSVKEALSEAGLLTHGQNAVLFSAPSHPMWDGGFSIADFVAVHSCEGSGGIAPLFPHTSGASWLLKKRRKEFTILFTISVRFKKLLTPRAASKQLSGQWKL